MNQAIKERVRFSFESDVTSSYLIVSLDKSLDILEYQVEMISSNPHPGIIPFELRHKDEKLDLYYSITSKTSLKQILKKKKFKRNEFLNMLAGILRVFGESREYMLNDKCFLLEEEYIFLNPVNLEVSLVYIPLRPDEEEQLNIKNFIVDLIVYSTEFEVVPGDDNYLQKILGFVRKDTFSAAEFEKLLMELISGGYSGKTESSGSLEGEKSGISETLEHSGEEQEASAGIRRLKLPVSIPELPDSRTKQKNPDTVKGTSKFLLPALLQTAVLVGILLLLKSGKLDRLNDDRTTTYLAVFLIASAASLLIWKTCLKNKSGGSQDESLKINMNKKEILSPDSYMTEQAELSMPFDTAPGYGCQTPDDSTTYLSNDVNDTVFLGNTSIKHPYLKGASGPNPVEISIDKESFVIGRLKGQADYVTDNNAVGKIHAEILFKDGSYYLKDLNSRNGTFLNGERLKSNLETIVNNGDRLRFADSEYIFILP